MVNFLADITIKNISLFTGLGVGYARTSGEDIHFDHRWKNYLFHKDEFAWQCTSGVNVRIFSKTDFGIRVTTFFGSTYQGLHQSISFALTQYF